MRKMKTLALILAALMIAASLCACSVTNPNYTVLEVGDMDIGVNAYYNYYKYYAQMWSMYGYDVTTTTSQKNLQEQVFSALINNALPVVVAKQNGITLTEEEEAEVQAEYQEEVDSLLSQYASSVDSSITDEDAIRAEEEKLCKAELKQSGWSYTKYLKVLEEDIRNTAIGQKYLETLYADVNITEEDAKEYYDSQIEVKRAEYAEDPAQFFTDYSSAISNGDMSTILVVPEGYHCYKHILVKKAETEDEAEVSNINQKLEEIKAKIKDGVDFDELIEEYGEDTGMESEPYKTEGYIVSEDVIDQYYEGFAEAALALENIGDVTEEPVETEIGYHFIKYVGDKEAGDVPFDDVKEGIIEQLTEDEKTTIYQTNLTKWKEEIKITKHYDLVSSITYSN